MSGEEVEALQKQHAEALRTIDYLEAKLELALAVHVPPPEPTSHTATEIDEEDDIYDTLVQLQLKSLTQALVRMAGWSTQDPDALKMKEFAQLTLEQNRDIVHVPKEFKGGKKQDIHPEGT